ncbi:hypothetical protein COC42_15745 [Sphingomonas spermidinifaciens]|uniref:DUF6438 domain-containing protein n=1 Tax=Sphingomonas spermidinifaciens TaxID=1141889 RepID=A0A2A4AXB4_9SPHN|nr:DUF6438 domain-containing protein [Sphingomonas spermidinifaciens]PCD01583.1 hypothetical protein COC42_15745 [Sphingomonas spermidinifaciens]
MKLRSIAAVLPLLAAGCAMQPGAAPDTPVPIEREAVTYSTAPCFGFCPVYSVTMTPEGEGVFTGQRHVAATGERRFSVDRATAARFIEHLGAVKPVAGDRRIEMGSPDCGVAPTDMPSIDVRWDANTGAAPQSLHLYLGCRSDEANRVRAVLEAAPALLPIDAFVGKR